MESGMAILPMSCKKASRVRLSDRWLCYGHFKEPHTGSGYEGLPTTGTKVEVRGITIWRIVEGRIVEEWSSFSETGAYIRMAVTRLE